MNKQKKPLYRYYTIILIVIMALNFIIFPMFQQSKLETTNYSDFLNKIEEKDYYYAKTLDEHKANLAKGGIIEGGSMQ